MDGEGVNVVVDTESASDESDPTGGVPVPVAVFVTDPALTSPAVTVCEAGHVALSPGASVVGRVGVHVPTVAFGSDRLTLVRVTFPVLVRVML
jgi:hypothetical protein